MSDETTGDVAQTPEVTTQDAVTAAKSFSQEEVDRIVRERLARDKDKYAGFEEYKAAAAKLKEIEDSQKSESEKLAQKLATVEAERESARAELAKEKRSVLLLKAAVGANAINPSDANFAQAVVGIDPNSETAESEIKQAVEALKTSMPYLFKTPGMTYEKANPANGEKLVESDAQRRARLSGGGGNVFDPTNAASMGGGVVINKSRDLA